MGLICTQAEMDAIKNEYWRSQLTVVSNAEYAERRRACEETLRATIDQAGTREHQR